MDKGYETDSHITAYGLPPGRRPNQWANRHTITQRCTHERGIHGDTETNRPQCAGEAIPPRKSRQGDPGSNRYAGGGGVDAMFQEPGIEL